MLLLWDERIKMTTLRLSPRLRKTLVDLVKSCSTPQILAHRGLIILDLERTQSISATAKQQGIRRKTVWKWRSRWLAYQQELEALPDRKVLKRLCEVLADKPRPGHHATFNAVQTARIIALACEPPKAAGVPISHWTLTALAREAVRRGFVPSISRQTVWRFLKSGRPKAA